MYDDDLYGMGSGTSTQTEESTNLYSTDQAQSTYSPYQTKTSATTSQEYSSDYDDDYSVTPTYKSEDTYDSNSVNTIESDTEVKRYRKMDMPVIQKESQEVVSLIKTREKIEIQPRMKIAISMFAVILFSLVFLIIWNFASVSRINSMIAEKEVTVNELNASITSLRNEYNLIGNEEQLRKDAEEAGFVDSDETNTYHTSTGELYEEHQVEELPSNWFNDVCDFFSHLFS